MDVSFTVSPATGLPVPPGPSHALTCTSVMTPPAGVLDGPTTNVRLVAQDVLTLTAVENEPNFDPFRFVPVHAVPVHVFAPVLVPILAGNETVMEPPPTIGALVLLFAVRYRPSRSLRSLPFP